MTMTNQESQEQFSAVLGKWETAWTFSSCQFNCHICFNGTSRLYCLLPKSSNSPKTFHSCFTSSLLCQWVDLLSCELYSKCLDVSIQISTGDKSLLGKVSTVVHRKRDMPICMYSVNVFVCNMYCKHKIQPWSFM